MEVRGAPPCPQQNKASTLSRTEGWCRLRLPGHCVSKGCARPLLQAGRQSPEQRLSRMPRGFLCSSAPSPHPRIGTKMSRTLSSQGCLTLERTRLRDSVHLTYQLGTKPGSGVP